jgi:hypothetical protein
VVQGVENVEQNAVVQELRVKPVNTVVDTHVAALAVARVQHALATKVQNVVVLINVTDADAVVKRVLQILHIL